MKYIPPLYADGTSKPADSSYVTGNAATGTPGDYVDGRAIEHPMREILEVIQTLGGLTPDEADTTQLRQAIEIGIAAAVEAVDTSVPAATTDTSGIVELATEAEAAALTDASRVITPAALGALFGRSLGASGYQMFPGGMIVQWGYVSGLSSSATQVTFPMAFPSSCDALVFGNKGVAVQPNSADSVTLTGFKLYSTASGDSAWWIALGR